MAIKIPANSVIIPTTYASLGAYTGFNPRTADQLRIFIVGLTGEGKSTFAASVPNSLVLDFEKGDDLIPSKVNMRIPILNMEHYRKIYEQLIQDGEQKKHPVKRIIFDTGDEWIAHYAAAISREKGVDAIEEWGQKGAGWALLRRRMTHDLDALSMAGYSWMVIGHLQEKTITSPKTQQETTVLREGLSPGMSMAIKRKADYLISILRVPTSVITKETIIVGGKTIVRDVRKTRQIYKMIMAGELDIPGKGRIQFSSDEYELPKKGGWAVFKQAYDEAVAREAKLTGTDT